MKMGLLWYDADPKRSAEKKIDEAAARYREKFGVTPNTCYVNPRDSVSHPSLRIVAKPIVHLNHYLVGVDEESSEVAASTKAFTPISSRRTRVREAKGERNAVRPVKPTGTRINLLKA